MGKKSRQLCVELWHLNQSKVWACLAFTLNLPPLSPPARLFAWKFWNNLIRTVTHHNHKVQNSSQSLPSTGIETSPPTHTHTSPHTYTQTHTGTHTHNTHEASFKSQLLCNQCRLAAAAKLLQSCPTLCDPIDGSPPGSPVPGILQARTLEWVAISFSNAWKWKVKAKSLSHVWLFATPWTAAYQAPPSMGFSRQEYWSGLPLPSPQRRLK